MTLVKYIFSRLFILLIISCASGALYYLGNKILSSVVLINSANSYLYSASLFDCIRICLFVFVFVYSNYLLAIRILKTWTTVYRLLIAFISLITVTKILNLTGLDVEAMSSLHRQSSVRA